MNVAIIDTSQVLINQIISNYHITDSGTVSFYSFNDNFNATSEDDIIDIQKCDCIIINIDRDFLEQPNPDKTSAGLIFDLRVRHKYYKAIILSGLNSISNMLRLNSSHTVLSASNIYYQDILSDFSILNFIQKSKPLLTEVEVRKSYATHITNFLDIRSLRHNYANLWAIRCIGQIQKLFNADFEPIEFKNSFSLQLLTYLYEEKELNFDQELNNLKQELEILTVNAQKQEKLKNSISQLENKCLSLLTQIGTNPNIRDEYNRLNSEINKLKQELIIDLPPYLTKKNDRKKMILVDDLSDKGWFELYKDITKDFVELISFPVKTSVSKNQLQVYLEDFIHRNKDGLSGVILDLKLLDVDENESDVSKYTGISILKGLKKDFPELPVLVTSASNKIKTFQICNRFQANGYWIKPGIDDSFSSDIYYEQRNKFKKIVESFLKPSYLLRLKMYACKQKLMSSNEDYLWSVNPELSEIETYETKSLSQVTVNTEFGIKRERSIQLIDSLIEHYNNYLEKLFVLDSFSVKDIKSSKLLKSIGMIVGAFIEEIHSRFRIRKGSYASTGFVARVRGDKLGTKIYDYRNTVWAHSGKFLELNTFIEQFQDVLNYLLKEQVVDLDFQSTLLSNYERNYNNQIEEAKRKAKTEPLGQNTSQIEIERPHKDLITQLQSRSNRLKGKFIEKIIVHFKNK